MRHTKPILSIIMFLLLINIVFADYKIYNSADKQINRYGCLWTGISERGLTQWDCRNTMSQMIIFRYVNDHHIILRGFIIINGTDMTYDNYTLNIDTKQ